MIKYFDVKLALSLKQVFSAIKLRCSCKATCLELDMRIGDARIYRMTSWPDLPPLLQKAAVFQLLSVMSTRTVNGRWIRIRSRMANLSEAQTQELIELLAASPSIHTKPKNPEIRQA